jgi:diadenosine tetraphosphate (Ap4A) HIT family hydrolase
MSERAKYYTGQSLETRERVALRIPVTTTLNDFKNLALEPIAVFEKKESGHQVQGVVKLNQYTATPYEVALFPTHRPITELTDLRASEGATIMESVYDTAKSMKQMLGDNAAVIIGINQHHNVENLPAMIERGNEKVTTRVQTIDQLHIHVYAELPGEDKNLPFSQLDKAKQREIRDPYIFAAAELVHPYVKLLQAENPDVWGNAHIQDKHFPLGLNIHLPQGLETIKTEAFFTGLQTLQNAYRHEYNQVTDCFVDTKTTDEYSMFKVQPEQQRLARTEDYLQSHPEYSDHTRSLLNATAKQHASFAEVENHYHTFVRGAAFTIGIYQNEHGETQLNWQPRIISRGNVLSSFGIFRNGTIIPDERKEGLINNAHTQLYETIRSHSTEPAMLKKGQRISTHTPRLDSAIREEAIQKAQKELSHFADRRGNENILRNLLNGSAIELSKFRADPLLINGRHLEIEAYLQEKVQRDNIPTKIFDRDIVYHCNDQEVRIAEADQPERLAAYLKQREAENPNRWGATIADIAPAKFDEPGVIKNLAGEILYAEQPQYDKHPLAFYGRPKSADTIRFLLSSHHKGVAKLSDIEDLVGTRVVVEDLEQVEQSVTELEETFGEDLLHKRNLYAQPYPHSPLFRSTFLYFHDAVGAIAELQVCTRNVALLSSVGHALEFKPKLEENKAHVTELLHIPPDEVTPSHLLQVTKYPFESVRKRLETEEWVKYMGKVEGLADIQEEVAQALHAGVRIFPAKQ